LSGVSTFALSQQTSLQQRRFRGASRRVGEHRHFVTRY
jgi:hypothetical protein